MAALPLNEEFVAVYLSIHAAIYSSICALNDKEHTTPNPRGKAELLQAGTQTLILGDTSGSDVEERASVCLAMLLIEGGNPDLLQTYGVDPVTYHSRFGVMKELVDTLKRLCHARRDEILELRKEWIALRKFKEAMHDVVWDPDGIVVFQHILPFGRTEVAVTRGTPKFYQFMWKKVTRRIIMFNRRASHYTLKFSVVPEMPPAGGHGTCSVQPSRGEHGNSDDHSASRELLQEEYLHKPASGVEHDGTKLPPPAN